MSPEDLDSFGFENDQWLSHLKRATDLRSLTRLGEYVLLEEISRGGQGVVYRARRVGDTCDVALKRLHRGAFEDATTLRRFEREIASIQELDHPNIVAVHDVLEVDGEPILVMDWIEGVPLDVWAGRVDDRDAILGVFSRVADAIEHAHSKQVIHRDLKPSNILVDEMSRPFVVDFGIAAWGDSKDGTHLTRHGDFLGTPVFSSPEQLLGEPLDERSDIFSLGVMLYVTITQAPLESCRDLHQLLNHARRRAVFPKHPRECVDDVAISRMAMAYNRADRYESAAALRDDLESARHGEPLRARLPSTSMRLKVWAYRHRFAIAVAMVLLSFGVTMTALWTQARRETDRATRMQAFLEEILLSASPSRGGGDLRVLDAVREAASRIDTDFADDEAARQRLHATTGDVLLSLWHEAEAIPYLREALLLVDGDDREEATWRRVALGRALITERNFSAIDWLDSAVSEAPNNELRHQARVALATAQWSLEGPSHFKQAEQTYRDVLARNPSVDARARALHGLGRLTMRMGDLDAAADSLGRVVEAWRNSPQILRSLGAKSLNLLALVEQRRGRYSHARRLLSESIDVMVSSFGESWKPLLLWRLGRLCQLEGDLSRTRHLYRQSLWEACVDSSVSHPEAATSLTRLADRLISETQRTSLEDALDVLADLEVFNPFHTTASYCHLAVLEAREGRVDSAKRLYVRALDRGLAPDHPLALETTREWQPK